MTEESINLSEVEDLIEKATLNVFPSIVIDGIKTENEFIFFHNRTVDDPEECIPMYFECEGEMVKLGLFPMTLDFLLTLRNIGDYTVTLCTSPTEKKEIDLNNPETLLKFIKL